MTGRCTVSINGGHDHDHVRDPWPDPCLQPYVSTVQLQTLQAGIFSVSNCRMMLSCAWPVS